MCSVIILYVYIAMADILFKTTICYGELGVKLVRYVVGPFYERVALKFHFGSFLWIVKRHNFSEKIIASKTPGFL